ncbi:hypothetical protein B0T25DRAFT_56328 [Lasiosphaeria hispida]|uniref:Fungal N-terminal domain-containing protein n=1 Tax=Lasiosphaeria hispida TaxID=260671 RepID=A0AAJ0MKP1_9PEZI|nr:hypothetical protein B0T25DRAFT_56328 [Lasiosphaeria hispida]
MSGFEIAGVVLGALPLLISALEHYRSGKSTTSALIQWRGQLDTLISRLKTQDAIFYLDSLELLRAAGVPELVGGYSPSKEECAAILSSSKTGKEMQQFLGPLYETLLEILERYERCLKKIAAKIRHIQRLDKV